MLRKVELISGRSLEWTELIDTLGLDNRAKMKVGIMKYYNFGKV